MTEIKDENGKDRPCIECRWYMRPYHCGFHGNATREAYTCSYWEEPKKVKQ